MTTINSNTCTVRDRRLASSLRIAAAALLTVSLAGCKTLENQTRVAGWELTSPTERHPIMVSQQPETLTLAVPRGGHGLSASQRADVLSFAQVARSFDAGNTKLVIQAPSGSANETAAIAAVHDAGALLRESGFGDPNINIEPFDASGQSAPPVKISFLRFIADGPDCGKFPTNLAREPHNLPAPNLGCASQKNFAAMVVNPADLLGPRKMGSRTAERRLETWQKYIKGEASGAEKSEDEQVKTDGE